MPTAFAIAIPNPEELLVRFGLPVGLVAAVLLIAFAVRTIDTIAKPFRGAWSLLAARRATKHEVANLEPWIEVIFDRMEQLWVRGDRAPLHAAERDSPMSLRGLTLTGDHRLLHPSRRSAVSLETGESIELGQRLRPGELFRLLDSSVLIVGSPGSGKSVLLWSILRDIVDHGRTNGVPAPVVIELYRWSAFDDLNDDVPPRFEDFVVSEVGGPRIGVPRKHVSLLMARGELTLLLDGLDELRASGNEYALRCLRALSSFVHSSAGSRGCQLAITCRDEDYAEIVGDRGTGIGVVKNALRIEPFSPKVLAEAFMRADPSPGRLPEAVARLPEFRAMLGTPLWLSVAEAVYLHAPMHDPLAQLDSNAQTDDIAAVLYPRWLGLRIGERTIRPLANLASIMRNNGQQTLYLDSVNANWLARSTMNAPARNARRLGRALIGLLAGLVATATFGLITSPPWTLVVGVSFGSVMATFPFDWYDDMLEYTWLPRLVIKNTDVFEGRFPDWLFTVMAMFLAVVVLGVLFRLEHIDFAMEVFASIVRGVLAVIFVGLVLVLVAVRLFDDSDAKFTYDLAGSTSKPMGVLVRALLQGILTATLVGVIAGYIGSLAAEGSPVVVAASGALVGLVFGVLSGLNVGLRVFIDHWATRIALAVKRLLPLSWVTLLDYACRKSVMYPAGPGYRFRHRTLGDYLADVVEVE